jgi:hypothetical protein
MARETVWSDCLEEMWKEFVTNTKDSEIIMVGHAIG